MGPSDVGRQGRRGARGEKGYRGAPGRRVGAENPTFLGRIYIAGMYRGTWALFAYASMAVLSIVLFHRLDNVVAKVEANAKFFRQQGLDADYKACLTSNKNTRKIRELIILSTDASTRIDLTKVPGFDNLDKATRQYFTTISSASIASNEEATGFRQRALAGFSERDCEAEFPHHTPGIVA